MQRRQLLLSTVLAPALPAASPDTVETTAGKVRGLTPNGVAVFRGIPYANSARFLPSTQSTLWAETLGRVGLPESLGLAAGRRWVGRALGFGRAASAWAAWPRAPAAN